MCNYLTIQQSEKQHIEIVLKVKRTDSIYLLYWHFTDTTPAAAILCVVHLNVFTHDIKQNKNINHTLSKQALFSSITCQVPEVFSEADIPFTVSPLRYLNDLLQVSNSSDEIQGKSCNRCISSNLTVFPVSISSWYWMEYAKTVRVCLAV